MGLLQEGSAGLKAKICDQSTPQIFNIPPQRAPNIHPINGFAKIMEQQKQLATTLDTSPPIPEERKRRIQKRIGTFLYYDRSV